ncbi:MAG: lipoprotein-releasing ABC transporter permease subunit [Desulfobulbaceae bacterium]|jgi:lipoprotein-releasing system permease protein|nr:lipoprotein-releasing ABC transporter permease subunit [Desulfobulbaceae bacterium]MDH3783596.1 lipoprotein-releasing ABC transporter permease subunit [Desulfobulbaceae bacterium]MDH3921548.1 lipoprotein-releasing ABC transporter permease subunit [Desulfobulbaceae bacterium]
MGYEWFISLRYLKARRRQGFISLISIISVAGVTVGVMALIVVLAVMTGFTDSLREKILGINSHIVIQRLGRGITDYRKVSAMVLQTEGVLAATPYTYSQTMLSVPDASSGVVVRGIDPATANNVLSLSNQLVEGSVDALNNEKQETDASSTSSKAPRSLPGIILGKEIARSLRVDMGDNIRLFSPSGPLTPMGVIPKIKTCRVVGIFDTGMYEYDSSLAYVSLTTAQDFLELDEAVHGLELKVDDIYKASVIAKELEKKLGFGYVVKDWISMNKNLFSALKLEKTAMFIVLALIVLVAAFNIISTLIMVVMSKGKDIAILKSMGATSKGIMKIFIYEGLVIGLTGTVLGVIGGLALCEVLSRYQFIKLPSDVYPITTLPVKILPMDVTLVAVSAALITLLATIYPSWKASKIDPAVALRYE